MATIVAIGRRDLSAEHSMRITVGHGDPARGQARKLLRLALPQCPARFGRASRSPAWLSRDDRRSHGPSAAGVSDNSHLLETPAVEKTEGTLKIRLKFYVYEWYTRWKIPRTGSNLGEASLYIMKAMDSFDFHLRRHSSRPGPGPAPEVNGHAHRIFY